MDISNLQIEPWPKDDSDASHARRQMLQWLIQLELATSEPDELDDDDNITGTTIESLLDLRPGNTPSPPLH